MRNFKILVVLSLLVMPAQSMARTLEDLLVEKGVITPNDARGTANSAAPRVYWDKGSRIEFPDNGFTFGVTTEIQTRYTFTDNDQEAGGPPNTSSFDIKKARVTFNGTALNKEFAYKLESEFSGQSAQLKDAWLQWNVTDWSRLKMGQFKPGISRQWNTSEGVLQFPDRSLASSVFTIDRETGAAAQADLLEDKSLTVGGQVFNGESHREAPAVSEGINKPGIDTRQTAVGTVRYAALGQMNPFVEGDVSYTEDPAVNVGAAYAYSGATRQASGVLVDSDAQRVSADANFKWIGTSVHSEFFWARFTNPLAEAADLTGGYVQAGYFLTPKKLEVALRWSGVNCDDGKAYSGQCVGNDSLTAADATINYFFWEHYLKAQLGYSHLSAKPSDGGERNDTNRYMLQLSSIF